MIIPELNGSSADRLSLLATGLTGQQSEARHRLTNGSAEWNSQTTVKTDTACVRTAEYCLAYRLAASEKQPSPCRATGEVSLDSTLYSVREGVTDPFPRRFFPHKLSLGKFSATHASVARTNDPRLSESPTRQSSASPSQ